MVKILPFECGCIIKEMPWSGVGHLFWLKSEEFLHIDWPHGGVCPVCQPLPAPDRQAVATIGAVAPDVTVMDKNITTCSVKACDCVGTSTTPGLSIRRVDGPPDRVTFCATFSAGPACDVCHKPWELRVLHPDGSTSPASDLAFSSGD